MDPASISALAALAGSAIGAMSSFATTWLSHNAQQARQRSEKDQMRREALYGSFIDEASALYADAAIHELTDTAGIVRLYSLVSRIRLFASPEIVEHAEAVLHGLIETYRAPNRTVEEFQTGAVGKMDPLRAFSEECRSDLARF